MAEKCLLNVSTDLNEVDENKNPSLSDNSVMNKTNVDRVLLSSDNEECIPQNVSTYSTVTGHSIPPKNVLSDSGFHCENFDNNIPSNINNDVSVSSHLLIANEINKNSEVSPVLLDSEILQTSFGSTNDNSFSSCKDSSFNTVANTTTNVISSLFEKLTLNSAGDAYNSTSDEHDLNTSVLTEETVSINNLSTVENHSVPLTVENPSMPIAVENHSVPVVDNHSVPVIDNRSVLLFEENFSMPNKSCPNESYGHISSPGKNIEKNLNDDVVLFSTSCNPSISLDSAVLDHPNSDVKVPFNTSKEDSNLDVSNLECQLVSSKTSLDGIINSPASTVINVPDNTDGKNDAENLSKLSLEALQEVSFNCHKDSSVDGLNEECASKLASSKTSFDCTFNSATKNDVSFDKGCDGFNLDSEVLPNFDCQIPSKPSLDGIFNTPKLDSTINLPLNIQEDILSNDAPNETNPPCLLPSENVLDDDLKQQNLDLNTNVSYDTNGKGFNITDPDCLASSNNDNFKCPLPMPTLNNLTNNKNCHLKSPGVVEDNFEGEEFQDAVQFLKDPSFQALESLASAPGNMHMPRDSLYMNFDPLYKKPVQSPNNLSNEVKKVNVELEDAGQHEVDILDKDQIVNKHVTNISTRESFGNILLSFDSPMKSNSARNSACAKASLLDNDQKLYTEEEFQQALKICELTMQEHYLKAQKEMEEENLKKEKQTTEKFHQIAELCKVLGDIVSEMSAVTSDQKSKIDEMSIKIENLESEKQKLESDLKTSSEDLQSVETTFSDFHKRYVQCKDMLKTYKDNEDRLKLQVESLNEKLVEQEQVTSKLQEKINEMAEKANAEVASAKKGGDAQLAVLKAQLKKSELKVSSLESDLKQVRIENDKLSGICDDLMAKVSEG